MFGIGKERGDGRTGPAQDVLDEVREVDDTGWIGDQANRFVHRLLDVGIDGRGPFDSAAEVSYRALRRTRGDTDKAVDRIVSSHLAMTGVSGFVTSLGGYFTMPVSLPANVAGFYVLATRMTAAIAAVRGHDLDDPRTRSAVLLCLVGADADDVLAKAGVGGRRGPLANLAAERLPGPALTILNKAIGFKILATAGRQTFARFGRGLPLVGGAVGGGLDVWLIHRVAVSARAEFPESVGARGIEAAGR